MMVWVPTARVLTLSVAVPEFRGAVPRVVFGWNRPAAASWKVTCPVGAANPGGAVAVTVAVSATAWPRTGLAGDAVAVTATGASTVCTRLPCAPMYNRSPLYCAAMLWTRPANALVVKVACPPDTTLLARSVPPS